MLKKLISLFVLVSIIFSLAPPVYASTNSVDSSVKKIQTYSSQDACQQACDDICVLEQGDWQCQPTKVGFFDKLKNFFKKVGTWLKNITKKVSQALKPRANKQTPKQSSPDQGNLIHHDGSPGTGWIVTLKSDVGDSFEILYPQIDDTPYIAAKNVAETWEPPVIHIQKDSGFSKIGLNPDYAWDGEIIPATEKKAMVDADLFGYFDKSINLVYLPGDDRVEIYSKLGKKHGYFDLATGTIEGDFEVTKGETNLFNYFDNNNDQPFTICVSDVGQYWAEIGIFADKQTVGIRPCNNKPWWQPENKPLESKLYPPLAPPMIPPPVGNPPQKPPFIPHGPGGKPSGGGNDPTSPAPTWEFPGPSQPSIPSAKSTAGEPDSSQPAAEPFPVPENNPGESYGWPEYDPDDCQDFADRTKESYDKAEERAKENAEAIDQNIAILEEMLEKFGLSTPEMPEFDPSVCCPTWQEDGKCCSDLDLSTPEGRQEYTKRLNCLVGEFWDTQRDLSGLLSSVNTLTKRVAQLDTARANMALLAWFTDMQKGMSHVAIDVATGGGGWISGVLKSAIGEVFGGDVAATASGDIEGLTKGAANDAFNEITDYKSKVREVAVEVADAMALKGNERERFLDNMVDKFGDNPASLADPTAWLKGIVDILYDNAGGAASDFVETVNKMEANRNRDLKAAWVKAQLLKQINAVIDKVRTEECGKRYVTGVQEQADEMNKKREKYRRRFDEDSDYLIEALSWIMDNMFDEMTSDNPSIEELKQRLLEELQRRLCKLGFDICWVDIEFEISYYNRTETNGLETTIKRGWKIEKFRITKRQTRKDPCPCPQDQDEDEEDTSQDDDQNNQNQDTDESSDQPSDCPDCDEATTTQDQSEDNEDTEEALDLPDQPSETSQATPNDTTQSEQQNNDQQYDEQTQNDETDYQDTQQDDYQDPETDEPPMDEPPEEPQDPEPTCQMTITPNDIVGWTYELSDCQTAHDDALMCVFECGWETPMIISPDQPDERLCYQAMDGVIYYDDILPCEPRPIPDDVVLECINDCLY